MLYLIAYHLEYRIILQTIHEIRMRFFFLNCIPTAVIIQVYITKKDNFTELIIQNDFKNE